MPPTINGNHARLCILPPLRSLNVLVLAGFTLVSVPLITAILLTRTYVDDMVRQGASTVTRSVNATREAQRLLDTLATLERNARQYHVVGSPDLVALYVERQEQLRTILARLRDVAPDDAAIGHEIEQAAAGVLDTLRGNRFDSREVGAAIERFDQMHARSRELRAALEQRIDASLAALQRENASIQRVLYGQAAALIPLALLLAAVFTVLIARPIRRLGLAIRQLGEGGLDAPVEVRGPLDIEELGHRLDWLRRRLHQLEQEKHTFLSHVSHELKTPLASIREGVELLLDGSTGTLAPEQRDVTAILHDSSVSLQRKIEDLLNFNAWRDNRVKLRRTRIELPALIDEVLGQHALMIRRLGLRAELDLRVRTLEADRENLRVILDNVISNAIKFSPPGGRIRIATRAAGAWQELHISDEGPGIPASERERVFEPFYQGMQRQQGHVRGTGIGLSVVRACARAQGGYAECIDGELSGAHIRIRLPQ